MSKALTLPIGIAFLVLSGAGIRAQDVGPAPVAAGKGAYAASIPANAAFDKKTQSSKAADFDAKPVYILDKGDRPVPSNHWDSSLFFQNFGVGLWPYPLKIDTSDLGIQVFYPSGFDQNGDSPVTKNPVVIGGKDFAPTGTKAKDWSDWMVSFRMAQSDDKYIDTTLGEGMPYVWLEYHGVNPTVMFGAGLTYFDLQGATTNLPLTSDCIGITYEGRNYGVFAPDGTTFTADGEGFDVTFSGASSFLVLCPLPTPKDIGIFHKYAFAVPRQTQLSWKYDPDLGTISTTWKIKTELLKGAETQVIQGWLPHHYRNNIAKLDFIGVDYLTGRGTMHCAVGNEFTLTYPFQGVLPNLPPPAAGGADHPFDPARLQGELAEIAANPKFGGDTYWGGKDLVRYAQASLIAKETNDPSHDALVKALHDQFVDWYTYAPGKKDHYFAYYPEKKALVGFNSSYGSDAFTDNHFHYGYFTTATALLAMQDSAFAQDYGPMAKLVAKQYANWDRDDKRFPFLRTFDVWQGHSWAGGVGSANGTNNQESTSEATQSWLGLILLGQALGDKDMVAAGVMGYNFESHAAMEYWFNANGDVFPADWKHSIAGIVWSAGKAYGTWFTGDPAWIYGIQWVPSSPALSYFVQDPAFAKATWENMLKDFDANQEKNAEKKPGYVKKAADIASFDGDLQSYMLGYVLMYDPAWVTAKMDELWANPDGKFAHNPWMANVYYMAHSMTNLGHVDWSCHGSSATSMVYVNDQTKVRTYIVWNPGIHAEPVQFFEGNKPLGSMTAKPQLITGVTSLTAPTP